MPKLSSIFNQSGIYGGNVSRVSPFILLYAIAAVVIYMALKRRLVHGEGRRFKKDVPGIDRL